MEWRRVPERWRRLVRAFIAPRWAEFATLDGRAHRRRLNTGIGMGGPVKPFLWAVGFGPAIYAVEVLTGGPMPTY
eukprot:15439795-Alexandrium_andersonii.AAC.1